MWLIIFYAQKLKVPLLPPINIFQDAMDRHEIDGINVAFNKSLKFSSKNSQSFMDIVCGFFSFYREFNFESVIISAAMGCVRFRNEMGLTIGQPAVYIEDPFDKRRSMVGKVSPRYLEHFREAMTNATVVLNSCTRKNFILKLLSENQSSDNAVSNEMNMPHTIEGSDKPSTSIENKPAASSLIDVGVAKLSPSGNKKRAANTSALEVQAPDLPSLVFRHPPKSITVEFEPEDLNHFNDYVQNYMSGSDYSEQFKRKVLCTFFVHFTVQALQLICRTERRHQCSFLPEESSYFKNIAIDALYVEIYKNTRNLKRSATHPKSKIPSDVITNIDSVCHVYCKESLDSFVIDFHNAADLNTFDSFFKELSIHIRSILSVYFSQILFYYYLAPMQKLIWDEEAEKNNEDIRVYVKGDIKEILKQKFSIVC